MNEKEAKTLLVVSIVTVGTLYYLNRRKSLQILEQKKLLRKAHSVFKILGEVLPHVAEQMPDTVMIPERLMNDMNAFSIMSENDLI